MYYLHSSHNSLTCLLSTTNYVIVLFVRVWKELTTFLKFFNETMTQETVQRRFLKCFSLRGALKVVSRYAWKTEGDLPRCVSTPMPAGVELCPLTRQTATAEREGACKGLAWLLSLQVTMAVFTGGPKHVTSQFRARVLGSETELGRNVRR